MTPELKRACEIVFQEHKNSASAIVWTRDIFHGRVTIGLREMAKETLLEKKVIAYPNKAKRTITAINPHVIAAETFEAAIEIANRKVPTLSVARGPSFEQMTEQMIEPVYKPVTTAASVSVEPVNASPHFVYRTQRIAHPQATTSIEMKWYFRPLYYYVLLPFGAVIAGAAIAWLLGFLASTI